MSSTSYELYDSSNLHFNVYWVIKNGKKMWKECFYKDEDPNIFKIWWKLDNLRRASYINKLIDKGISKDDICDRLQIHNESLYRYYVDGVYMKMTFNRYLAGGCK